MSTTSTKPEKAAPKATMSKAGAKPAKTAAAAPSKAPLSALDGSPPPPAPISAADPAVVEGAQSVILGPMMRKKELIEAVVTRTSMKKKDVKPVVDGMLEVLAEALADKRELNLQPLGRIKVRREKQFPNGRMLVAKIRQTTANTSEEDD